MLTSGTGIQQISRTDSGSLSMLVPLDVTLLRGVALLEEMCPFWRKCHYVGGL